MKGTFITIEGVEGCGKSTQIQRLVQYLRTKGREIVTTREPGGALIAETIRTILLDPANRTMSPAAELLLYEAARAQHVAELIRPALARGAIVVSDRFLDSTTAYQGAGRAWPRAIVEQLHRLATGDTWPDLTIVIDLPPDEGLARSARLGPPDRLEREPLSFHRRVRDEFLQLAEREPQRVRVVDGARTPDAVAEEIKKLVDALLGAR